MALKIVHGWKNLAEEDRGAAVALGNFDGVHKGHQAVIAGAARAARQVGAPLGVISFEPHPRRLFHPEEPAFRLMTTDQQARALEALGVERFYVLPFDFEMANFSDRGFAETVLAGGLGVKHVAVGFDISFGKGRTGSPEAMAEYGKALGFTVSVAAPVGEDGYKYSSTAVREALRAGRPDEAAAMLGRPFAIEGVVRRGQQLGRKLGFPTANVMIADYVVPRLGVYAVTIRGAKSPAPVPAVANYGLRPTVEQAAAEPRLESHVLGPCPFGEGDAITVEWLKFLRPEMKFGGVEELRAQIGRDRDAALAWFGR